jgi:hypothetical protein
VSVLTPTTSSGNGSTVTVPVPTMSIGDIAIIIFSVDNVSATSAGTPGGFTSLLSQVISGPDGHIVHIAWKRLTAVDSGTYNWTLNAVGNYASACIPLVTLPIRR